MRGLNVAVIVLVALFACRSSQADDTPIFDSRPYAEAMQAAEDEGKWFLVRTPAVSLHRSDIETDLTNYRLAKMWRDEKLASWLKEHAVVVLLDPERHIGTADELELDEFPTIVAFRNGAEFDRLRLTPNAARLLSWLEGIDCGETWLQIVRRRVGARPDQGAPSETEANFNARFELARVLVQSGQFDEATDEFAWLFKHMQSDTSRTRSLRFWMASHHAMKTLVARHPPALQRFTALRDQAAKSLENPATVTPNGLLDWLHLNEIIGDTSESFEWFKQVKDDDAWRKHTSEPPYTVVLWLVDSNRWSELGALYRNPLRVLESRHFPVTDSEAVKSLGLDEVEDLLFSEMKAEFFQKQAAIIYAALLASHRNELADQVADRARTLDGSPQMVAALVGKAIDAGVPQPFHVQWLGVQTGHDAKALRKRLAAALASDAATH
jgi:hypothetical protein